MGQLMATDKNAKTQQEPLKGQIDISNEPAHPRAGELFWACRRGDEAKLESLLSSGIPVDACDARGARALHAAAGAGRSESARVLLRHGANPDAKDSYGCSPLHDAAAEGHRRLAEMLLDAGADVDAKDAQGATPLLLAAECGHEHLVKLLLSHGADIWHRDSSGRCALDCAPLTAIRGHFDAGLRLDERRDAAQLTFDLRRLVPQRRPATSWWEDGETRRLDLLRRRDPSLISHPISALVLHLKWSKLSLFYWSDVVAHALFLALTSTTFLMRDAPHPLRITLWCVVIILILRDAAHLASRTREWAVETENWLRVTSLASTVAALLTSDDAPRALSLLCAWIQASWMAARHPQCAPYAAILQEVAADYIRAVTLLAFPFIAAFAAAFYVLMRDANTESELKEAYMNTPQAALLRVSVMASGELDFTSLPLEVNACAYVVLSLFLLVVSLVLVNVLHALAVHDVQKVRMRAESTRLESTLRFALRIESLLAAFDSVVSRIRAPGPFLRRMQLTKVTSLSVRVTTKCVTKPDVPWLKGLRVPSSLVRASLERLQALSPDQACDLKQSVADLCQQMEHLQHVLDTYVSKECVSSGESTS